MANPIQIIPIKPPSSMYRLLESALEKPYIRLSDRPLHRICSLMRKMGAATVISEEINSDHDVEIGEEVDGLNSYFESEIENRCTRLTFVDREITEQDQIMALPDDAFLSSVTIMQYKEKLDDGEYWHPFILKSAVTLPHLPKKASKYGTPGNPTETLLNNYFHINGVLSCQVFGGNNEVKNFTIKGTCFCQQNGKTSVCAHSALKMTLNNFPEINLTTKIINDSAGINPTKKDPRFNHSPGWGMTVNEVSAVIESMGLNCQQYNFFAYPTWDYVQHAHRLIESKAPSLLVFSTSSQMHVVPLFGHTLNSDMWRPEAEYQYRDAHHRWSDIQLSGKPHLDNHIPSSAWVDHFIIHDDNFGPYYCLPVDSLRKPTLPNHDPFFRAYLLMGMFDANVPLQTSSREAEWISIKALEQLIPNGLNTIKNNYWIEQICNHFNSKNPWIIRTALTDKQNYANHLSSAIDFEGVHLSTDCVKQYISNLPDWFYISEVSFSDLFTANKSKLLDVIYACDKEPWDPNIKPPNEIFSGVLAMRLPGLIYFPKSNVTISIDTMSHIPLMRINPDLSGIEW